jgi:hypothetical protein
MFVFYIIARPIGLCLDWWLGHHAENEVPFNAKDLYTLLSLSTARRRKTMDRQSNAHSDSDLSASLLNSRAPSILSEPQGSMASFLDQDAVMIAQGAILSSKRTVKSLLIREFFSVLASDVITWEFLEGIGQCGFSRICIVDDDNRRTNSTKEKGQLQEQHHRKMFRKTRYFVVKEIFADVKRYIMDMCCVRDLPAYDMYYFQSTDSILLALNQFQSGESRIGVVTSNGYPDGEVKGYFSMEDVVEAIIQEDIADEKDSKQCAAKVVSVLRINKQKSKSRSMSSGGTLGSGNRHKDLLLLASTQADEDEADRDEASNV